MKLSIIVTHYKEPDKITRPLFDSIRIQRGIDFSEMEIIIVNDGEENRITLDDYPPCPVYQYAIEKCGVSACRNFGLDKAEGDYVMFCDCDDRFCSIYGLKMVFQAIDECYDAITSCFVEEHCENGMISIVRRENECTFIHGKVYRRKYLLDNGIRFNEYLTIHEDGFFNSLALMLTENRKHISTPFYAWIYRLDSVTKQASDNFLIKTYLNFLDMREAICDELKKRGLENRLQEYVSVTFFDAYYEIKASRMSKDEYSAERIEATKRFRKFYIAWRDTFRKTRMDLILATQAQAFNHAEKIVIPNISFEEFLDEMKAGVRK